jgi:hypothetical protein
MGLRALRWQAEEDLIFDELGRSFHRAACPELLIANELDAESSTCRRLVPAGTSVELVSAPLICARCRPEVVLALGESQEAGSGRMRN